MVLPCLFLLAYFELAQHSIHGAITTLSPSPRATVCNVGDRLEVNCTTNANVLTWSLMYISENGMVEEHSDIITSSTAMTQLTRMINSSIVTFSRRSEPRSSPLISSMIIGSVTVGLNGTRITCMEFGATTETTTVIYIVSIQSAHAIAELLSVSLESEAFEMDGVSVSLQWSSDFDSIRVSFNVSATPVIQPISISMTGATFTVAYNTFYNVSIVATLRDDVCNRVRMSFISLHYTKCILPLNLDPSQTFEREIDDFLVVTGHTNPAIEGSTFNLSCSSGVFSGPTMITCMENGEWEPDPRNVMCIHKDTPGSVNIQIVSEDLERDGVRVTLEWTQDNSSFYSYNVSVTPNPASALTTERMRAQLKVSYDIPYNVSVQATPTRGNGNFITVSIEVHYATCSHPVEQVEDSVRVIDFKEPALRGSNVTLARPAGMTLNGPDTLLCTGSGEWEPDPNKVECKNESIVQIKLLSQDGKIAVASSMSVFVVTAIVFFIVGFLCGHFCQKKRKLASAAAGESVPSCVATGGQTQIPYYDDVVLKQEVELKENVAYGPL